RTSLHPGRRGRQFAAVAASEPRRFAASARVVPWRRRAARRRAGPTAAAWRAAFAALHAARALGEARGAARRLAGQPVAPGCAAPREGRGPRELQALRGPRAPPALLPVSLPVSVVARRRLSPSQHKR